MTYSSLFKSWSNMTTVTQMSSGIVVHKPPLFQEDIVIVSVISYIWRFWWDWFCTFWRKRWIGLVTMWSKSSNCLNPVFRWNHALKNFFTLMANSYPTDMLLSNIIHVIWCFRKKNAIIKLLLEHKADPSVQNNSGQTAIHLAIAKEQDETVKALVLASCDVHVKVSKISRSELLSSF